MDRRPFPDGMGHRPAGTGDGFGSGGGRDGYGMSGLLEDMPGRMHADAYRGSLLDRPAVKPLERPGLMGAAPESGSRSTTLLTYLVRGSFLCSAMRFSAIFVFEQTATFPNVFSGYLSDRE